jgi:hypothetical protein
MAIDNDVCSSSRGTNASFEIPTGLSQRVRFDRREVLDGILFILRTGPLGSI